MFLNKKKIVAADQDRTALQEAASIGTTPGQRLIGIFTAAAASVILLGGIYFKAVKAEAEAPAPVQQGDNAAGKNQKLNVPLDLNPYPAKPAQNGGVFRSQGALAQELPPGMASAGQTSGAQNQQQGAAANPEAERIRAERQAATARSLTGDFGGLDGAEPKNSAAAAFPGAASGNPVMLSAAGGPTQGGQTALSGMLIPTSTPGSSASYMQNQHMTLIKSTSITCNLDTAIMTDQMGFTACLTDYPVLSMDGAVVLMERGTKIDGEYARGMAHGAKAVFVLWTRAVTPKGVVIALASPATDPLGRAGIGGEVDNKFWDRYGGALMFSILQDGVAVATTQSSSSGGNTQINLGNTQATGTTAAGEILRQNSDVAPSLYLPQGARVGITTARDLDFSTVYALVLAGSK